MIRLRHAVPFALMAVICGRLLLAAGAVESAPGQVPAFDHSYRAYGALLGQVVREPRVDYQRLKTMDVAMTAVQATFASADVAAFSHDQQMAFWINAYNFFTLRAIVDHYPIKNRWFSFSPRNSIRQIDGVWTDLTWAAGGRTLTLDDIEHKILRPEFKEPLVHFTINCASTSCPVLAAVPYVADGLHTQLETAAGRYLSSPLGLVLKGTTVSVSNIFKWYGDDFVERFQVKGPASGSATDRAVLGVVATYGPEAVKAVALDGRTRVRFLKYDWSLNDTAR